MYDLLRCFPANSISVHSTLTTKVRNMVTAVKLPYGALVNSIPPWSDVPLPLSEALPLPKDTLGLIQSGP